MTFEEAKKIFLNRGHIEVPGGTYYDADKWREAITVISKWLEQEPCDDAVSKKMDEWIPVSDGLPKLYEEVIVTDIETIDAYVSRYVGNGYWECDNGLYQNRIIAWQQKPKPYKAESEVSE